MKDKFDEELFKFESDVSAFDQHVKASLADQLDLTPEQKRIIDGLYKLAAQLGIEAHHVWSYIKGKYVTFDIYTGEDK